MGLQCWDINKIWITSKKFLLIVIIIRKSKWIKQNRIKRKWDLQHVVRQVSESEWKGQGERYTSRDLKAGGNASSRALKGSGRHVYLRALKGVGGGMHPQEHWDNRKGEHWLCNHTKCRNIKMISWCKYNPFQPIFNSYFD